MARLQPGWLLREAGAVLARCERGQEDMRAYQSGHAVPFLRAVPKSAAYMDMGLGKTVAVLTVLDEAFSRGEIAKALIIAPVRVAVQTWPTEFRLWRHLAWMQHDYSLIRPDPSDPAVALAVAAARARERADSFGSPEHAANRARTLAFGQQRVAAARSPARIHIINREAVAWLVEFFGNKWPYDAVVVDESTSFADHTSARFKALAMVAQRTKRLHLLSGTPAPEGILDLFAQTYLLDSGKRFGRGITHFRNSYMMMDPYKKTWKPQNGAVEQVTAKMGDIALVMREDEYLTELKGSVTVERPIVLEREELRQYKQFQRNMILELPDGVEIEAVNAGVLAQKLLQWCSGAVYDADRKVHYVHDHKLAEMRELADETRGEPMMIAYWFKSSLAVLRKAFPKATVMDRTGNCVDDWNKGRLPYLLVHPQSAGHGLNMQHGPGRTLAYYDTPAALEYYLQLNKRLDRSGQKRLVRIVHLAVQGTIEQYAVAKLKSKESMQDTITGLLQAARQKERKHG